MVETPPPLPCDIIGIDQVVSPGVAAVGRDAERRPADPGHVRSSRGYLHPFCRGE